MTASLTNISGTDRLVYAAQLAELLGDYRRVIDLMDRGIAADPTDPRLYRLRGHRYISLRRFEEARADFLRAVELIEGKPDEHEFYPEDTIDDIYALVIGDDEQKLPQHAPVDAETNTAYAGMYKSTLQASIWYHLGLSHYLLGDFNAAYEAFTVAAQKAIDTDTDFAALDWRFMCLRRAGRMDDAAALVADVQTDDIVSHEKAYLRRVQMYTGRISADELLAASGEGEAEERAAFATQGYGLANWYLADGDVDKALPILRRVVDEGFEYAFGRIAAERDLATLQRA